jgi:ATP-binding cassette subfamily E protein 1
MIQVIRDLLAPDKYVIVVEHDLSVLDYLSDFICCLYGKPGAYGVVTLPFSVREGINIFLAGFVPTENLRFREEGLTFKVAENAGEGDDDVKKFARYTYPGMSKTQVNNRTMPCMPVCVHRSSSIEWKDCQFAKGDCSHCSS